MMATVAETLSVSDFTVTGFKSAAIEVANSNLDVNRIEVDGTNAIGAGGPDGLAGLAAKNDIASANTTVSINNSHVHHLRVTYIHLR